MTYLDCGEKSGYVEEVLDTGLQKILHLLESQTISNKPTREGEVAVVGGGPDKGKHIKSLV